MEIPRLCAGIPISEILQALGSIGQIGIQLQAQMIGCGYRIRAMGCGQCKCPEGFVTLPCLPGHNLQIIPELCIEKHAVSHLIYGVMVIGELWQMNQGVKELNVCDVLLAGSKGMYRQQVEIAGMFLVGTLDTSCPLGQCGQVLVGRFVTQEIGSQSGMILDLVHSGFRIAFQFRAHEHALEPCLCT